MSSHAWSVRESAALFRPRRPERASHYRLIQDHFDADERVHAERFAYRHGHLRYVVRHCVEQFLDCGRHESGFARLRCVKCESEHLVAFSCQTRNFCPSSQAKRAALFAEHFVETVRVDVPHRHIVFTIPKVLRVLFERDRRLLTLLSRSAYDALSRVLRKKLARSDALPGVVHSIQTFGSFGNWHPHIHALATDGLLERGGGFIPSGGFPVRRIEERFRRLLLGRLRNAQRLSSDFHEGLLSWHPSGFSVHAGEPIDSNDPKALERVARYVTRSPVALAKVHPQRDGRVKLLTPRDPDTGLDYRMFESLEWVHAITTQIPDKGQHMVRYCGAYANRARTLYRSDAAEPEAHAAPADAASVDAVLQVGAAGEAQRESESLATRERRRSWARLLRRIYEVDPLACPRCGSELRIVSVITDPVVVDRILQHRQRAGLRSPFEPRAPPAA